MTVECGAFNPAAEALLDRFLAPVSLKEFVSTWWERQFLHVPGEKRKFDGLFDWPELNSLLNSHRFSPERFRLWRDGGFADPSQYLRPSGLLGTAPVLDEVRKGATLVLASVEEVSPRCREMVDALQETFRCYSGAHAYVSFQAVPGFPTHFDNQGLLVTQVAGRKYWRVWEPTFDHPLNEHQRQLPPPKDRSPYWEGTLEQGSLFHLPRGWWHEARSLGEPSLHLTLTVSAQTGVDLLRWAISELRRNEFFRRDVPRFTESERHEYVNELVRKLQAGLGDDAVERFLEESMTGVRPFPRFDFPSTD